MIWGEPTGKAVAWLCTYCKQRVKLTQKAHIHWEPDGHKVVTWFNPRKVIYEDTPG